MRPPVFPRAAAADVEDAVRWYEAQRDGLGDEFLETVRATLEAIRLRPQSAPIVHRDMRRQLLRRFPCGLFYRIVENQVVVLACFHAKRSPRVWCARG